MFFNFNYKIIGLSLSYFLYLNNKNVIIKYYNFINLLFKLSYIGFLNYFNFSVNDSSYNNLYTLINKNKCLTIKFTQWILTQININYDTIESYPKWLKKFNQFYEECEIHDFSFTQNIYYELTGNNIEDDYEVNRSSLFLSSGSIGQVYKLKHKETQEYHALKVKHPFLEDYIQIPKYFIKTLLYMYETLIFRNKYCFPIDIEGFFSSLENQLNFNLEAKNLLKMRENFKDNYLVIIPELYKHNENIIIMKYEEGDYFENCKTISEYNKYKICLLYLLFYQNCLVINNFNHGDLHKGNWKIRKLKDSNNYSLIIYDFGVCYSFENNKYMINFLRAWEEDDVKNMSFNMYNLLKTNTKNNMNETFINTLINMIEESKLKPFNLQVIIKNILQLSFKYKFIIDYALLNIFISCSLCENELTKYKLMNINEIYNEEEKLKKEEKYYSSKNNSLTLEYINFCNTKNIFPELKLYYENLLKEKNIIAKSLFENIEIKLNSQSNKIEYKITSLQLDI
jgi:predicted unusual protein kinase regulating ubiquinone biosynthesis (AarF/ABC1/UbiB family)